MSSAGIFSRLRWRRLPLAYARINNAMGTGTGVSVVTGIIFGPYALMAAGKLFQHFFFAGETTPYFHELIREGLPVDFPDHTIDLISQEIEKYESMQDSYREFTLAMKFKPSYNFNVSNDFDAHSYGNTTHIGGEGCTMYMPYFLTYNKLSDIENDFPKLKMFKKGYFDKSTDDLKLDWSSNFMKKFKQTLLLTDDAKRYVVFRAVLVANADLDGTMDLLVTLIPAFICAGLYAFSNRIGKIFKFDKFARHRLPIAAILCGVSFCSYRTGSQFLRTYLDLMHDVDSILDKTYQRGAVECFQKALDRNLMLRKILGDKGEKLYDVHGNDNTYRGMPLTKRLENVTKFQLDKRVTQSSAKDQQQPSGSAKDLRF